MKAQVSLEYLMLAIVSLTLISFSLGALSKIKEVADVSHEILLFNSTVNSIYNSAEELCAMGSGNKLTVDMKTPLSISSSGKSVEFSKGNYSAVKQFSCDFSSDGEFSGTVEIANKGGAIEISSEGAIDLSGG